MMTPLRGMTTSLRGMMTSPCVNRGGFFFVIEFMPPQYKHSKALKTDVFKAFALKY